MADAVALADGLAVLLVVEVGLAVVFAVEEAEAFAVTLAVAFVVTFTVGVGDGFLVAAFAVALSNESAITATKSFLNRDPI